MEGLDRTGQRRIGQVACGPESGEVERRRRAAWRIVELAEAGMVGEQLGPQLVQQVVGQPGAQPLGERAQYGPVLPRLALREHRPLAPLHPALGVDVEPVLLGVGRARQDDVGTVRAGVAMRAEIDHEGVGLREVDLSAPSRRSTSSAPFAHPGVCRPGRGRSPCRARRRGRPPCAARSSRSSLRGRP